MSTPIADIADRAIQEPKTGGRTGPSSALGGLLVAALSILLAWRISRPLILPDESGFLLNAFQLRGDKGPNGLGYYHGYSAVLAPFLSSDLSLNEITDRVQLLNAALSVVTYFLLLRLARTLLPQGNPLMLAAVSAVVAMYPAYRLFASLALSENLYIPITVGVVLLFVQASEHQSLRFIVPLAILSGGAAFVHARAVALPVAVVVAGLALLPRSRATLLAAATALTSAVSLVGANALLDADGIATLDSDQRDTLSGLISANLGFEALLTLPFTALGQLFYLSTATAGLFLIGALTIVRSIVSAERMTFLPTVPHRLSAESLRSASWIAGTLLASSLTLSALFLNQQRGDRAIYGRYLEGVIAPVLLIGLLVLIHHARQLDRVIRAVVLFIALSGMLLVVFRGPGVFDDRQQLVNIAGVFPVVDVSGHLRLSELMLFGLVSAVALYLLGRWRPGVAVGALGILFCATTLANDNVAAGAIEGLSERSRLVPSIELSAAALGVDCVALDQDELEDRWFQENYRLSLLDLDFEYWDSRSTVEPCSPLVISTRPDLDERTGGGWHVDAEARTQLSLWVLGEQNVAPLENAGLDLIADPDAPLPSDQQLALELNIETETDIKPGERVHGTLTITNNGPRSLLPDGSFAQIEGTVNIGVAWLPLRDSEGETTSVEPTRLFLDQIIRPGETVEVPFKIRAVSSAGGLVPNDYWLTFELVQEGFRWTGTKDQILMDVRWGGDEGPAIGTSTVDQEELDEDQGE